MRTYRVGSRGSKLALWQAENVVAGLRKRHPGCSFDISVIHTTADKRPDVPLQVMGDKSLFLKEIEAALLDGSIDFAVHSLKDVPSRLDSQFALAAVLEREDARDVLLPLGLAALAREARVGTSSLRREAQLRALRQDLSFAPIRGNVDTRLRKLAEGQYDGIVLAAAGLRRLGVAFAPSAVLDMAECLPAPGQAAICVETLAGNGPVLELLLPLNHAATWTAVEAERAFAAELNAGCQVPLGAFAQRSAREVLLNGIVAASDGRRVVRVSGEGRDPAELGRRLAGEALAQGAGELLRAHSQVG